MSENEQLPQARIKQEAIEQPGVPPPLNNNIPDIVKQQMQQLTPTGQLTHAQQLQAAIRQQQAQAAARAALLAAQGKNPVLKLVEKKKKRENKIESLILVQDWIKKY